MQKTNLNEWYAMRVCAILGREVGDDEDIVVLVGDDGEVGGGRRRVGRGREALVVDPGGVRGCAWAQCRGLTGSARRRRGGRGRGEVGPQASKYRSVAAKANYLGVDRLDLQFTKKGMLACRAWRLRTSLTCALHSGLPESRDHVGGRVREGESD